MKLQNHFILAVLMLSISSCLGDKKLVDISEMDDTSFVNTNFNGNTINFEEGMSACDNLSTSSLARIYDVSDDKITLHDPKKVDFLQETDTPVCQFYIESGESDFMWLRGSISIHREIGKDEFMGDVAEATGGGENWEEAWALQKSISKSSEWIANLGMAAVWNEKKKELKIKYDGYTLNVYPPTNRSNQIEVAKNRDYKKAALAIAQAAGFTK